VIDVLCTFAEFDCVEVRLQQVHAFRVELRKVRGCWTLFRVFFVLLESLTSWFAFFDLGKDTH
jgi:hypothetical protein